MTREQFIIQCAKYVGIPYIWGGADPRKGLDCSGLVQILLSHLNLDPPGDQTADDLMRYFINNGEQIVIDESDLGCLVFCGPGKATHVAMALNSTTMIEAGGGGSKTTTVEAARKINAQVRIAPIKRRQDIICVIRPHGLPWGE